MKITNQNTCTIGDGANDIQMIKYSGMGVAFKGKDKLGNGEDCRRMFKNLIKV